MSKKHRTLDVIRVLCALTRPALPAAPALALLLELVLHRHAHAGGGEEEDEEHQEGTVLARLLARSATRWTVQATPLLPGGAADAHKVHALPKEATAPTAEDEEYQIVVRSGP